MNALADCQAKADAQHDPPLAEVRAAIPAADAPLTDTDRDKCLKLLSYWFTRPVLSWQRTTGEKPLYTLILGNPETRISVGESVNLMTFAAFRRVLYDQGILLPSSLREHWDKVLAALLRIVELVDDSEDTKVFSTIPGPDQRAVEQQGTARNETKGYD